MELSIRAPLCDTSYGLASLNIIKSLYDQGHRVSVFPIGGLDGSIPEQFHQSLRAGLECAQTWNVDAPCVTIFHQFSLAESASRKRVGFPIFELDKFNEIELRHLRSVDQLLVPSAWGKQVLVDAGLTQRIDVVPLGVDTDKIFPCHQERTRFYTKPAGETPSFTRNWYKERMDEKRTIFLAVGKKELRKYHDGLITCFEKAFSKEDNVELWIVWGNRILDATNPTESGKWTDYYKNTRLSGKVRLYEWIPSHNEVIEMMQNADCFVGVSRAEGWNLGLLEAMAVGLPVITNDYSGHTEFVTSSNSLLVPFRKKETAVDGVWFHGQGSWMALERPEEELIVQYMRDIHTKKQHGGDLYNMAGVETAKLFTWTNSSAKLLEALS